MINPKSEIRHINPENQISGGDGQSPKDKIKIIRIIARLNVGGPARHVVWLTKELQNSEFQTVLLAGRVPAGEEDMSYFAVENGVAPVFIEEMSRELSPKDIISLWKVFQEIRREKPDVIHTHTAKAGTVGRAAGFLYRWLTFKTLIGKPRRIKLIHTYHGHIFHSYYGNLKTKVFLFIEKTLARMATDKIVVISDQQFQEIHEQFGVGKKDQFEIIPLGIDLAPFADWKSKRNILREEIGAADDEILIGLVGRLTEVKNHSLFLKVAEICKQNQDVSKLKFVIIGDGHLRETLEAEAEARGLKDSIIFIGNRNDADVFYAGLDIIALTSLNEGTPLSLIEAMANEKPIISTSVGGVIDLLGRIKQEETGFQVCERGLRVVSGDAKGFCNGLLYLIKDRNLQNEMVENGKLFVRNQYSKERLVNDIKNLNRKLNSF